MSTIKIVTFLVFSGLVFTFLPSPSLALDGSDSQILETKSITPGDLQVLVEIAQRYRQESKSQVSTMTPFKPKPNPFLDLNIETRAERNERIWQTMRFYYLEKGKFYGHGHRRHRNDHGVPSHFR